MAPADYNKYKEVSPTSQNDSGSTVDKAQPINIIGEKAPYEVCDDVVTSQFDASTEVTFGNYGPRGITFGDGGAELYINDYDNDRIVQFSLSTAYDLSTASYHGEYDYSGTTSFVFDVEVGDSGNTMVLLDQGNDGFSEFSLSTAWDVSTASFTDTFSTVDVNQMSFGVSEDGQDIISVEKDGSGNVDIRHYALSTSWDVSTASGSSSSGISDSRTDGATLNASGDAYYITDGSFSNVEEYNFGSSYAAGNVTDRNALDFSFAGQGIAFREDNGEEVFVVDGNGVVKGFATDESRTGDREIVLNWTNISSESDLAVYDQNGNLLPYEIESFDATSETAVLWAYDSWVRDDTVQAQIVYGDGPASSEENVTGTWNNTGQNAVMVQHLQDDPLTATDSTSNNNDGTVNGAVSTSGQFDGAGSFDGTDDYITQPVMPDYSNDHVVTATFDFDTDNSVNTAIIASYDGSDDIYEIGRNSYNELFVRIGHVGGNEIDSVIQTLNTGETYEVMLHWDASTQTANVYVNGSLAGSPSTTVDDWTEGDIPDLAGRSDNSQYHDGFIDEVKVYNSKTINAEFAQAEYDASPKAGQVFFSQSAAQETGQTFTQSLTEVTGINDVYSRDTSLFRDFNESSAAQDTVSKTVGKKKEETISINETLTKTALKSFLETINISDIYSRTADLYRDYTEGVGVNDTYSEARDLFKNYNDAINVKDTYSRTTDLFRNYAESTLVNGAYSRDAELFRNYAESTLVNDTYSRDADLFRNYVGAVGTKDILDLRIDLLFDESVIVNDADIRNVSKVLSETVGSADNYNRVLDAFRNYSEIINIADTATLLSIVKLDLTESVSINDAIDLAALLSFSESVTADGTYNREADRFRTESETVGVNDSFNDSADMFRSYSSSIGVSADVSKAMLKSLSEAVTVSDNFSTDVEYIRDLSEQVNINDVLSKTLAKSLDEEVLLVEDIASLSIFLKLTESVGIDDAYNASRIVARTYSEAANVSDALSKVLKRSISESIDVKDALLAIKALMLTESISISTEYDRFFSEGPGTPPYSVQTSAYLMNKAVTKAFREYTANSEAK